MSQAPPRPVAATPFLAALIEHLGEPALAPQHRERAERLILDLLEPVEVATIQVTMPRDERALEVARALIADPADTRTLAAGGREVGTSGRTLTRKFLADTRRPATLIASMHEHEHRLGGLAPRLRGSRLGAQPAPTGGAGSASPCATHAAPELAPAIRASACALPLRDQSVDAAMAILSVHHWDAEQERGVREMRRVRLRARGGSARPDGDPRAAPVARGPVVIMTYDPEVSGQMWLMSEYLPEVAELDRRIFPRTETLAGWLGGAIRVEELEIPDDTPDWMLGSFWAHPERVLDAAARAATSGFARMDAAVVGRVVESVRRDLARGAWERRHGHLRRLRSLDVGLRLMISAPP